MTASALVSNLKALLFNNLTQDRHDRLMKGHHGKPTGPAVKSLEPYSCLIQQVFKQPKYFVIITTHILATQICSPTIPKSCLFFTDVQDFVSPSDSDLSEYTKLESTIPLCLRS